MIKVKGGGAEKKMERKGFKTTHTELKVEKKKK